MRAPSAEPNCWLCRFTWLTATATLLLICSGGMVTSKNVGLAVPDWPTTFGYNMFLFPISKWIGGIFFEHVHRLIASIVGFMTIILAVWLAVSEEHRRLRYLGYAALGAVILQGVLGGLRVTLLKDEIGIFHACLAQAYLGMLTVLALITSPFWQRLSPGAIESQHARMLAWLAIAATVIIYLQLGLGATMRHEHRDLSILDFPTAYGKIIPDLTLEKLVAINAWRDAHALSNVTLFQIWLQMAHRFVALIIAAAIILFWFSVRIRAGEFVRLRPISALWLALLACQIALGAWTIWSNKAADVATAHVAVGATMLAVGIVISAICLRLAQKQGDRRSPAHETVLPEEAHAL